MWKRVIGHENLVKDEMGVVHVKLDKKALKAKKEKEKFENIDKRLHNLETLIYKIYEKIDGRTNSNNQ